jgi:hypothetical protein
MGSLAHFNLGALAARHGLMHFVETGTARGDSLALAAALPQWRSLHSIEIVPELADSARARFAGDKRVQIWEGDSGGMLSCVLQKLPAEPCLFWLDAHFPGAHTGADYAAEAVVDRRLPLQAEVEAIAAARPGARDVLLIDDARIYQRGPYAGGELPDDWPPLAGVKRSLDFVRNAYGKTHGVVVDYSDQGYVMVVPKGAP